MIYFFHEHLKQTWQDVRIGWWLGTQGLMMLLSLASGFEIVPDEKRKTTALLIRAQTCGDSFWQHFY